MSGRGRVWEKDAAIMHLSDLMAGNEAVLRAEEPLTLKINGISNIGALGFAVTNHRVVALRIGGFRSKVTAHIDLPLSVASEWDAYTATAGNSPAWGVETACSDGTVDALFSKKEELDRVSAALQLALTTKSWLST
jgi:hypothetical protein